MPRRLHEGWATICRGGGRGADEQQADLAALWIERSRQANPQAVLVLVATKRDLPGGAADDVRRWAAGHGIQHVLDQLVHDFQRHRDCVIGSDGLESVNGLRLVAHTKYADRQRWDSKEFRPARDLLEFLCDIPNVDLARRAMGHLNKVEPARARYPKH